MVEPASLILRTRKGFGSVGVWCKGGGLTLDADRTTQVRRGGIERPAGRPQHLGRTGPLPLPQPMQPEKIPQIVESAALLQPPHRPPRQIQQVLRVFNWFLFQYPMFSAACPLTGTAC